ncbi:MAG: 5S rRNA maturation endonuclease (ribonuclease M5) [Sulfurimonas sp.]|jgi:5S rRNA maturation endonuclease (ribonuclease M5)
MAFKRNDIKRLCNIFDCSEQNVQSALYMASSYLKQNNINTYTVARCVSILSDKLQKAQKQSDVIEYPDFDMKHETIRKYRADIVSLYNQTIGTEKGWGYIASELKNKHNIKVSRQTVRAYILKYENWRLLCQI